jgi:hypothetical protein
MGIGGKQWKANLKYSQFSEALMTENQIPERLGRTSLMRLLRLV